MGRQKRGRRKDVINIREMLRLAEGGFSQTQIAQSCNVARSTVQEYLRHAQVAGLTYKEVQELPDDELLKRLGKEGKRVKRREANIDFARVSDEFRRPGVTLQLLWHEEVQQKGIDLSYSTFCRRFRAWSVSSKVVMHQAYTPGEKLFVDYAGMKIGYVDRISGERKDASVFVAALGASSYTYTEATANEKLPSWLGSHCRAFEFFGGVTAAVVPDNLKAGVKNPWWYEPELNRSYQDFSEYYSTAVLPTRIQKPRDKAKVEKAVQEVERWVIAPLRDHVFYSTGEINDAIKPLLDALNTRRMRDYGASRQELFERLDREALKALPAKPYQFAQWKKARVNIDYHIEFERHWYSVPYYHVRQEVWLKVSEKFVEVFCNNQRITFHERGNEPYRYTTLPEHMPPEHAAVKSWTPERFLAWSKGIGIETHAFVQLLFSIKPHPEQAYRAVLGLQRLSEKYTPGRIEAACLRANHYKLSTLRSIRSILEHDWDRKPLTESIPQTVINAHANLRGATVFH
jgi:transposase